jgi:hypothetical protein
MKPSVKTTPQKMRKPFNELPITSLKLGHYRRIDRHPSENPDRISHPLGRLNNRYKQYNLMQLGTDSAFLYICGI